MKKQKSNSVSRDPGKPGSRRRDTGLRFFHAIVFAGLARFVGLTISEYFIQLFSKTTQKFLGVFCLTKIYIGYSPAGRSVSGKTVPSVLDTARRPRAVSKTEGIVFPNTDRPRLVNTIFIFFSTTQRKACERPEHFRAVIMARFATN